MASRIDDRDTGAKELDGLLGRAELEHQNKELRRTNQQLTQKIEQLDTLHEIARVVTTSLGLDEVLTRVVEAAVCITKAEEGSLMLLDERTNELYLRAQKGLGEKYAQGFRTEVEDSIAGEVVKTSKPQRLTSKDRVLKGYSSKLWGTLGNGAVDLLPGPLETATV